MDWFGIAATAVLLAGLAWIAAIDLRELRIPDRLSFPLLGLGLATAAIEVRLSDAVIGAVLGFAVFVGIAALYRLLRQQSSL